MKIVLSSKGIFEISNSLYESIKKNDPKLLLNEEEFNSLSLPQDNVFIAKHLYKKFYGDTGIWDGDKFIKIYKLIDVYKNNGKDIGDIEKDLEKMKKKYNVKSNDQASNDNDQNNNQTFTNNKEKNNQQSQNNIQNQQSQVNNVNQEQNTGNEIKKFREKMKNDNITNDELKKINDPKEKEIILIYEKIKNGNIDELKQNINNNIQNIYNQIKEIQNNNGKNVDESTKIKNLIKQLIDLMIQKYSIKIVEYIYNSKNNILKIKIDDNKKKKICIEYVKLFEDFCKDLYNDNYLGENYYEKYYEEIINEINKKFQWENQNIKDKLLVGFDENNPQYNEEKFKKAIKIIYSKLFKGQKDKNERDLAEISVNRFINDLKDYYNDYDDENDMSDYNNIWKDKEIISDAFDKVVNECNKIRNLLNI